MQQEPLIRTAGIIVVLAFLPSLLFTSVLQGTEYDLDFIPSTYQDIMHV